MSYSYATERPWLFTEAGQVALLKVRDNAQQLLKTAGAFKGPRALRGVPYGDSWKSLACLDRLVELDELRRLTPVGSVAGQEEVYVAGCKWGEEFR
jgi:hypothetical protein